MHVHLCEQVQDPTRQHPTVCQCARPPLFVTPLRTVCHSPTSVSSAAGSAATECHVFVVITTAIVLKNDLSWEIIGVDTYDMILFLSFIVLVPGAAFVAVVSKLRYVQKVLNRQDHARGDDELQLEKLRLSFDLQALGLGTDADRVELKRYVDGWSVKGKYAACECDPRPQWVLHVCSDLTYVCVCSNAPVMCVRVFGLSPFTFQERGCCRGSRSQDGTDSYTGRKIRSAVLGF